MNEKEVFALWNRTSERSFISMLEHVDEWRHFAATALLARDLSAENLVGALRVLARLDDKRTWLGSFESVLATRTTLSAKQIRDILHMHNAYRMSDEVTRNLQRQLFGLGATADEVISLMGDRDVSWREQAVRKFLKMEVTFEQWKVALRCWGDERHADVAPSLWETFRARFPKLDLHTLFEFANTCTHVQDAVVKHYLVLKPSALAVSVDQVHLVCCAAGLVLNDPAYGGALWVRECLDISQQAAMHRKAEQFLVYARKLKSGKKD